MVERHDKLYGYVSEKHCVFYEDHLPNPDGLTPVVTLSDYTALEAQLAELAAEIERLKQRLADYQRATSTVASHETGNMRDKRTCATEEMGARE